MNPTVATDNLRAAADVALFHARVEHGDGDRLVAANRPRTAAVCYRQAAQLYRYAARLVEDAAFADDREQDHTWAETHRAEAARLDGLAAGLAGGAA